MDLTYNYNLYNRTQNAERRTQNAEPISTLIFLVVIFNVLIPKAGFKIGGVPVYVGNILFFFLLIAIFVKPWRIKISDRNFMFMFLLFPLYCFLRVSVPLLAGCVELPGPRGAITDITANSIYPLIFPVLIMMIKTEGQLKTLVKIIITCILITIIYDIAQAVFGIGAIQIPGITVNYSDYSLAPNNWWRMKFNSISDSSKIFSTYQNGNLYGVNMLMFYPLLSLYFHREHGILKSVLLVFSCCAVVFLTGSRTVWVGALLYICLISKRLITKGKVKTKSFLVTIIFMAAFIFSVGYFVTVFVPQVGRFLNSLDPKVFLAGAGRTAGAINSFKWIFENGNVFDFMIGLYGTDATAGAYEMTYVAILFSYGIIGFIFWLLPIVIISLRLRRYALITNDIILNGTYRGIFIYMACAFIDGGWWLPPTVLNLWLLIAVAYKRIQLIKEFQLS